MKLSEAIRQGAKLRPQAFGSLYTLRCRFLGLFGKAERHKSCALGAAFEVGNCGTHPGKVYEGADSFRGVTPKVGETIQIMEMPDEWNILISSQANCPQCDKGDRVQRIIAHLNDDHRWTREEIALWVERVERAAEWLGETEREEEQLEVEVAEVRR